jgi:hypothetical protein
LRYVLVGDVSGKELEALEGFLKSA